MVGGIANMANEITKWNGTFLETIRKIGVVPRTIPNVKRLPPPPLREPQPLPSARTYGNAPMVRLPDHIDALRECSMNAKPWYSRFLPEADGFFYHNGVTGRLTPDQYRAFYNNHTLQDFTQYISLSEEERCPWCGAVGTGLFQCCNGHVICQGRSTGKYLRCFCGAEGWVEPMKVKQLGLRPGGL